MVGFTEPNIYEPRSGWRFTLAEWVRSPPEPAGGWQHDLATYWHRRTLDGRSLGDAWKGLGMEPEEAKQALAASPDSGLVPPELFSRVLARSRADEINHNDNVDPVVLPPKEKVQAGYDPEHNLYQPRAGWRDRLTGWIETPPTNLSGIGGFAFDLSMYWKRRTVKGQKLEKAWSKVKMSRKNANTSLHKNLELRGMIPPELIGYVVARARGSTNPADEVQGILLYPDPTI